MEYTDAPVAEGSEQPSHSPTAASGFLETAEGQASDLVAVMLSIVPGLGHIYKGHRLVGMLLVFGTPIAVGLALLVATFTAGFGFFLLPIFWIAVMVNVWAIPDRVKTDSAEEGEQVPNVAASLREALAQAVFANHVAPRVSPRETATARRGSPRGFRADRNGTSIRDNGPEIFARR